MIYFVNILTVAVLVAAVTFVIVWNIWLTATLKSLDRASVKNGCVVIGTREFLLNEITKIQRSEYGITMIYRNHRIEFYTKDISEFFRRLEQAGLVLTTSHSATWSSQIVYCTPKRALLVDGTQLPVDKAHYSNLKKGF